MDTALSPVSVHRTAGTGREEPLTGHARPARQCHGAEQRGKCVDKALLHPAAADSLAAQAAWTSASALGLAVERAQTVRAAGGPLGVEAEVSAVDAFKNDPEEGA